MGRIKKKISESGLAGALLEPRRNHGGEAVKKLIYLMSIISFALVLCSPWKLKGFASVIKPIMFHEGSSFLPATDCGEMLWVTTIDHNKKSDQ